RAVTPTRSRAGTRHSRREGRAAWGERMTSAFHTGGGPQGCGDRPGRGRDRLAAGDAGSVAPARRLGQVDGGAAGGRGPGGDGAGPGEDQGVLTLEEAVAAHAAGGAALGRVLRERGDLHRT